MADDNYSLKDILWEYSDFPPPGKGPAPLAPQAPELSVAKPPAEKEDASGSPLMSSLPENSMMTLPSGEGEIKLSCFSAVMPVRGWNQWVKWVAP